MTTRDLTFNVNTRGENATSAAFLRVAASMEALNREMKRVNDQSNLVDNSMQKVEKSTANAHKNGFKPLLDTALLLGPAIVPLGAAALAAGAAFGSMGAVGLLAFQGIKKEITNGTILGQQYQAAFKPVIDEFQTLEHIAAANVFGGINKGIAQSRTLFPLLNQDVALLSTHLGSIVGNVGSGFVALLHDLNPLLVDMAGALDKGAAGFQHWATTSQAPAQFVAFAENELPKLETLFMDVAKAVVHLGEAAAPIGGALLQALDGIAQAISHIPVPVLTAMILALDVGRLSQIVGGLSGVSKALTAVGLSASVASPIIAGLMIVGAAWAISMGQQAQQAAALTQAQNDVTAALQASNGAFDTNVQNMLAKTAADTGVTTSLDKLGLSQKDYFNALASGQAAQDHEVVVIRDRAAALGLSKAATIQLLGPIAQQINAVQGGTDKWNAEAKAIGNATQGMDANSIAAAQQTEFLKKNNLTVETATKKYDDAVAKAFSFTAQLGYMSKALDTLSNNNINATLQQDQLNLAMGTAADKFAASRQQVHDHGIALQGNTDNAISNRDWALRQIQAINQQAISYAQSTGSIGLGTQALHTNEGALRTSMIQAGFTAAQVDALLKKYAATPADVATSIRQQGAQAVIDALGDLEYWLHRIADPTWAAHIDIIAGANAAQGGRPAAATGGLLMGPGGPTDDNLLIRASAGEYVVNAGATAQYLPFLDSINNNNNRIKAYARGGLVGALNLTEAAAIHVDIAAAEQKARDAARASFGGGGTPGNFSGSLLSWVFAAESATGTPASWTAAILRRIMFESGGNPNAINNWDINAQQGDPSRGLMQTIGTTFNAYHQPGTSGNIYDPVANIAAALNYIKANYGSIFAIDPPVRGYRDGGIVDNTGLAYLHRGETVIPADKRGPTVVELGPRSLAALAEQIVLMDGEQVARLVTRRQAVDAVRGGRR